MLTKRGHSSFKKTYRPFPWLEPHFACSIGKCCVDATPCPVKLRCLARIRSISFCNAWPDNLGQGCVFEFRQLPDFGNHVFADSVGGYPYPLALGSMSTESSSVVR